MVTVFDVAAYILNKKGPVTAWKLQKLVYYSQAWSLVWDGEPLFQEDIQAWINGPVCPALYDKHRGAFKVTEMPSGNPDDLNQDQVDTVDAVLQFYGHRAPHWLSNLTHMEEPWKQARKGLSLRERGDTVISLDSMADYYGSLHPDAVLPE